MEHNPNPSVMDVLRKWHERVLKEARDNPPPPGTLYPAKMEVLEDGTTQVTLRRTTGKEHVLHDI